MDVIRHEFDWHSVSEIFRIPGKKNLSDPGTKRDPPLIHALALTFSDGRLPFGVLLVPQSDRRSMYQPI